MQTPSRIFDRLPVLAGRLLLLTFIAAVPLAGSAYAESLTLAWDANTAPNVAGYNVYRSGQSGVYGGTPQNGNTLITGTTYTDSSVQPGNTYYYVVTAVSTTGEESGRSAEVRAVIPSQVTNTTPTVNQAPSIRSIPSQTVTLPETATLSASASDDGLPNGTLSYRWSTVSGAGVSFSSPNAATTQATFASAGTYTLRVTVSDGQLSSIADTTVYVSAEPEENTDPKQNQAPSIRSIPSQTVMFPETATLSASASDDGLPNGTLSYQWGKISGAGVTFSTPNAATTQVAFASAGTYTLRVTVSDGQLSAFADATVYVTTETKQNQAPSISSIPSQTVTLSQAATLSANASDDGLPNGTLSYQWSKASGAGVTFTSPNRATTEAAFSSTGTYTLRVVVSDGELSASAYATVYVTSDPDTRDNTSDDTKGNKGSNGGGKGGGNTTTTDDAPEAPTTVEAEVTTDETRPGPPTNLRRSKK